MRLKLQEFHMSITKTGSDQAILKSEPIFPAMQLEMERLDRKLSKNILVNQKNLENYQTNIHTEIKAMEKVFDNRFNDFYTNAGITIASASIFITIIIALLAYIGRTYIKGKTDSLIDKEIDKAKKEFENEMQNKINEFSEKTENKLSELDKKIELVIEESKQKAEREIKKAIEIAKTKELEKMTPLEKEIVKDATKEIEKKPEKEYSADEYFMMGYQSFLEARNKGADKFYQKAIKFYKKAIELEPSMAVAYANLGASYIGLSNYKESNFFSQKAIELDPNMAMAYANLGTAYIGLNDYKEGKEFLLKALELNPQISGAFNSLGYLNNKLGRYEEAIKFHLKAIKLDSNNPNPVFNLACVYSLKKDKDSTLKYLEQAIDNGYVKLKVIEEDSDLDFIREAAPEEYQRIIEKLKSKLEEKEE
jgi:tetratricopeptide (TPR) repeat protein